MLTNLYPPDVLGGYELLALDVVRGLQARGHDVHVMTTGVDVGESGISRTLRFVRPFGEAPRTDRLRHLTRSWRNARAVDAVIARHGRPDVLLAMSQRRLGLGALRAYRRAGVPVVATVNDDWPVAYAAARHHAAWRAPIERAVGACRRLRATDVDRVAYLSEASRRTTHEAGVPFPMGVVEPQGVDCSTFAPGTSRWTGHGLQGGTVRLALVGRLHPGKGPELAIDAVAQLRRLGRAVHLTIAGQADDPRYMDHLRTRAETLGVSGAIEWLGKVRRQDLPDVYRAADVCLFVSLLAHEGQGLTYLEAMACGVPVVAWPSGGAREFLEQHPIACLAEAPEGPSVADGVLSLLRNPAGTQHMIDRALTFVRDHASLDRYVDAIARELDLAAAPATAAGLAYTGVPARA